MAGNLHLLGGTGNIGINLFDSIIKTPLKCIDKIWVYCDGDKASKLSVKNQKISSKLNFVNYSSFNLNYLNKHAHLDINKKNIVINMRGVKNKKDWLNKPLESLDTQLQSCINIIESDLWMYPNCKIIHLSSQLCDLIEGENSLQDICDGEDNYRKAYMISRLHQESLLTAHAFKYGIETNFLRLPFVYGFSSDNDNPWVLNSIIKNYIKNYNVKIRNPNSYAWFLYKDSLIGFLRNLITNLYDNKISKKTVSYSICPMLGVKVESLANFITTCIENKDKEYIQKAKEILKKDTINKNVDINKEINSLETTILETFNYARN